MEKKKLKYALPLSSTCKWGGSSQGRGTTGSAPGTGAVGQQERARAERVALGNYLVLGLGVFCLFFFFFP